MSLCENEKKTAAYLDFMRSCSLYKHNWGLRLGLVKDECICSSNSDNTNVHNNHDFWVKHHFSHPMFSYFENLSTTLPRQTLDAIQHYRDVLLSAEEHKDRLKTDSLQRLHAMHNLHQLLKLKPEGLIPTLRDGELDKQVKPEKYPVTEYCFLKALDMFCNCQRAVYSPGVSKHMHTIPNGWKNQCISEV